MLIRFYLILLALAISLFAQVSSPRTQGVAILDFEGTVLKPYENLALTDRFRAEVLAMPNIRVMERAQMDVILKEQGFQQSGACNTQECLVQMGQLLGVDKIIVGNIGKLGSTFVINARIIELRTGQIEKMSSKECDCAVEKLLPVMKALAVDLCGITVVSQSPSSSSEPSYEWLHQVKAVANDIYVEVAGRNGLNILPSSSSARASSSSQSK